MLPILRSTVWISLAWGIALVAESAPPLLTYEEVRATLREMLAMHVEQNRLDALLIKRSFLTFLEQFDPEKIYLLQDEVAPFLSLSEGDVERVQREYIQDRYSYYASLKQLMVKALERAQGWRAELGREFVMRAEPPQELPYAESYAEFASSLSELRGRVRQNWEFRLLWEKRQRPELKNSFDIRDKIVHLSERKAARAEELYRPLSNQLQLAEHRLSLQILKAVAKSMDAHSAYYSPEEAFELRMLLQKQFEGVGIALREGLDGVEIAQVVPGGPAALSGSVEAGDRLLEVDGVGVTELPYDQILQLLQGDGHRKAISLLLARDGVEAPIQVELVRARIVLGDERIQVRSVPFGDGWLGVVTLPAFYESDQFSAESDLRDALRQLKKQGKIYGLLLDMRNNSGGFLGQAVKVAGLFITSGVVVVSQYAHGEIHYLRDIDGRTYYTGPLLLLTSRLSASAAEIVAQALQDYGVALVVGDEATYGKGSIQYQNVTDPAATRFYKVTVGRYYTVSGRSTQIEGVQADLPIPTQYAPWRVGERYLPYPLRGDRMAAAYEDSLSDVDGTSRRWLERYYLPYLQRPVTEWRELVPVLKANSQQRIEKNRNFQLFLHALSQSDSAPGSRTSSSNGLTWGREDLQCLEALEVLRDMALFQINP